MWPLTGGHTAEQEVPVDLKSNLFWALASIILIASAMSFDRGPVKPLMAKYPDNTTETTG